MTQGIFFKPLWFTGYDIAFELLFGIVAFLVSFYAYKYYRLTKRADLRLFSIAFILLSGAYLSLGITNALNSRFFTQITVLNLGEIINSYQLDVLALGAYVILFLTALTLLAYMTREERGVQLFALIYIPILLGLFISNWKLFFFYVITTFLLFYISVHYLKNYVRQKNWRSLFILSAFVILLIARSIYIIGPKEATIYLVSHVLELGSYALIFISITHKKK